jgi:hypothetical protein
MAKRSKGSDKQKQKRDLISQKTFPLFSLEKALKIASAIFDNYAGKGASPDDLAMALGHSPTSSSWRYLCGAAIAYGITSGGYNAKEITLLDLGRRIVASEDTADQAVAKSEALLQPEVMRAFFEKYHRAKFPKEEVAERQLISFGLPEDRAKEGVKIIKENGEFAGIIRDTKTGPYVSLRSSVVPSGPGDESVEGGEAPESTEFAVELEGGEKRPPLGKEVERKVEKGNKVYISHGKNKAVVVQLKELLTYGKFDPIVTAERETTSISVPDKVFEDMRKCSAAVIHVSSEGIWTDANGTEHEKINDNVLIEIGGALALYGKNFVLLVEKGVALPSNLQGLYRCEYEGDKLDYDATMKLLKIFSEFK